MREIQCILILCAIGINCYSQTDILNYADKITVEGTVVLTKYEMPSGEEFDTYILKLDKSLILKRILKGKGI